MPDIGFKETFCIGPDYTGLPIVRYVARLLCLDTDDYRSVLFLTVLYYG